MVLANSMLSEKRQLVWRWQPMVLQQRQESL
jgi:hypothetical protein